MNTMRRVDDGGVSIDFNKYNDRSINQSMFNIYVLIDFFSPYTAFAIVYNIASNIDVAIGNRPL